MAIVPIVTVPNKTLETPCEKVSIDNSKSGKDRLDEETQELIQNLLDTLLEARDPEGAGLAAPQIGSTKRICIARRFLPNPEDAGETISKEYVMINPKIISMSDDTDIHFEGCLSIPDTYGQVERPSKIKVKYIDENGDPVRKTVTGYLARVMQHEIDHLDGILFTTKLIGETLTENEMDNLVEAGE